MACCNETLNSEQALGAHLLQLPLEAFCCMARMAHSVTINALQVLRGDVVKSWEELSERERTDLAAKARLVVSGSTKADTDYERLFVTNLRTIVVKA